MLRLSYCLAIIICFSGLLLGQSAEELGLVLTGMKTGPAARIDGSGARVDIYKLRLTFKNTGKVPVIIINPALSYGTGLKDATFHFEYEDIDHTTFRFYKTTAESKVVFEPSEPQRDNFRSMAPAFADDRPPENFTMILKPDETYVFVDEFEVEPQYKHTAAVDIPVFDADGKRSKMRVESQKISPRSFTLTYEYSFLRYVPDPDFLEKLDSRWRRYGRLPLGTNGTYTVTSEPIEY